MQLTFILKTRGAYWVNLAVMTSIDWMARYFGDYYYPEFADTVKYNLKDIFICIITEQCSDQEKVNVNGRKAAESTWMIDYAKSNDCMMWILPWQNERQRSVNNSWSCILVNLWGDRLHVVITAVLAAYIGRRDSNTLPASSWTSASTECQRFLVMYHG